MSRKCTDNEDIDSAGVYLVSVEDFEWRPRKGEDDGPRDEPPPANDEPAPTTPAD